MKRFTIDNFFFECMDNIGDMIILNVLFVLTSLPVITIGMTVTAMYQVTMRRMRGESNYVVREYFQSCRNEWKKSTKMWLIFLITGTVLLFDIIYSKNIGNILNIAIGCLAVIWCFVITYAFPLQARMENGIKNTLLNALLLSVKNFPYTIIMIILNGIPFLCIAAGTFTVQIAMPIYCIIGFSLTARINGIFLTKIFKPLLLEEKEDEN